MKSIQIPILVLIATLLSACCNYEHFFPRLFTPSNFDFREPLAGTVNNVTYTTKIGRVPGRGSFDVLIPQIRDDYEVLLLEAHEFYGQSFTYVRFGPVASDHTIYRIFVRIKNYEPLEIFRGREFQPLVRRVAKGYDREMCKIYEENLIFDGHPAIYTVYTQKIAGYYNYISMYQPGYIVQTHAVYAIDYGRYGVFLWVQGSSDSGFNTLNQENMFQILNRTWPPLTYFTKTFVLHPQKWGVR